MKARKTKNDQQQLNVLKGYMPADIAKAFEKKYSEKLEGKSYGSNATGIFLLTVAAVNMPDLFNRYGWNGVISEENNQHVNDVFKVPGENDYGVCVEYAKAIWDDQGVRHEIYREDGCLHFGLLGDIVEQYNINL